MDKKGEKIVSVYWFAILFIVAGAIVYIVALFYGAPYDVREIEADILTDKVAECVSHAGILKEKALNLTPENFLQECTLNLGAEDVYNWKEQEQYYAELKISEFNGAEVFVDVNVGNSQWKDSCSFESSRNLPYCLERSFYSVSEDGNSQYKIEILSIVRKTEKNTN